MVGMSVWGTSLASGAPLGVETLWRALGAGFCGPPPVFWPPCSPTTGCSIWIEHRPCGLSLCGRYPMGTHWQPGWGRTPPYDDWSLHIPEGLALTLRSRWAWEGVQGQGAAAVGGDLRLGSGPRAPGLWAGGPSTGQAFGEHQQAFSLLLENHQLITTCESASRMDGLGVPASQTPAQADWTPEPESCGHEATRPGSLFLQLRASSSFVTLPLWGDHCPCADQSRPSGAGPAETRGT